MQTPDAPERLDLAVVVPGRSRRRRRRGVHSELLRFRVTPAERQELNEAAVSIGSSLSRFCAEAALSVARGMPQQLASAQDREALAQLQRQLFAARTEVGRFGTNVNQAVAALNTTGEAPVWMGRAMAMVGDSIRRLDEVIAEVDRRLQRAGGGQR
jgi:uncharacterized protein (DUF1778 family)